jgi:multiple sugar transport system permease protein
LAEGEDLSGRIRWLGLANYQEALGDSLMRKALWNTAYYSFIAVPLGLLVALMLAVLLNQKLKGISFFRTVFYMPHVIGGVATIMMWMWVFNPEFGLLNELLRTCVRPLMSLGLVDPAWRGPGWIYSETWAKPGVILMSLWGTGGAMLIFLAALQSVPDQLYEAARIDGASRFRQFLHVSVPQITPAIFFNLVMGVIHSFQVFNEAYIMTAGEGGQNNALLFYVLYLYNNAFRDFRMGYASALAWILFLILLGFTLLIVRSARAWVYYAGEK